MHKFSTASTKLSGVRCAPPARPADGCPDPQAGTPGLLNVLVGVSRWLTRTAWVAHFYPCGFGFAIRTVRASHRLAPTSLRYKNLCIIRARFVEVSQVLLFTIFAVLSPPAWAQEPVLLDEIVARVNEEIITLSDLKKELRMLRSSLQQEIESPELLEQAFQRQKQYLLRTMIQNKMLVQKAEEYGIPDSVEPNVGRILEEMRAESGIPNMEVLDQYLRRQGSSLEDYRVSLKQRLIIDALLQQSVYSKITLLTPEIEAYYQENIDRYTEKAEVELKEILFLKEGADEAQLRKKAQEALAQLQAGVSFEDLAKRFSDGPTASQGGGIGSFKQGSMAAAIEQVAFQLEEDAVSGIIETEYGLQIIKVVSQVNAREKSLEEVRSEISMQLYQRKAEPGLKKFVDELIEQSYLYVTPKYREEYDVKEL